MIETQTLTDVGLSPTESKIYLSLVSLGPSPATFISKETGIHRANVYSSLSRLSNKGLVSSSKLDRHVLFSANDPSILLSLLKEKEDSLKNIIPQLILQSNLVDSLDIEVLSGLNAFTNSLFSFLDYSDVVYFIGNSHNLPIGLSAKLSLFFSQCDDLDSKFKNSNTLLFFQRDIVLILFSDSLKTLRIKSDSLSNLFKSLF